MQTDRRQRHPLLEQTFADIGKAYRPERFARVQPIAERRLTDARG